LEKEGDKKFYEQLIACDNFLYFKHMMIKRNMQLQEEALRLMYSKNGNNNDYNDNMKNDFTMIFIFSNFFSNFFLIFSGEEYEFIKQKEHEKEVECAIQMSLALEDEKRRLLELEEEEIRVIQ